MEQLDRDDVNVHRLQNKTILQRALPPYLKLSIARTIENNLFSKVMQQYHCSVVET